MCILRAAGERTISEKKGKGDERARMTKIYYATMKLSKKKN